MKYFSIPILMLLVFGCVGYTEKRGILRTDNCDAPGLEWMEAVEGYDKQEVIDLASQFEAAAKADAEQLKTVLNGSMAFSITASLR